MSRTLAWVLVFGLLLVTPPGRIVLAVCVDNPALMLVGSLGLFMLARWQGAGDSAGHQLMRDVEFLVAGAWLLVLGFYAMICRSVGLSGFGATLVLTAAFVVACVRRSGRPGTFSVVLIALVWCAVGYRALHPLQGPLHFYGPHESTSVE